VNDYLRIEVGLSSFAYVMSNNYHPAYQTAVADYSHTLNMHLDTVTPGANTVGVSGHDYTTPASIPEPTVWALMLVGFGGIGTALRGPRRPAAGNAA
jgi:hypothetical protein